MVISFLQIFVDFSAIRSISFIICVFSQANNLMKFTRNKLKLLNKGRLQAELPARNNELVRSVKSSAIIPPAAPAAVL